MLNHKPWEIMSYENPLHYELTSVSEGFDVPGLSDWNYSLYKGVVVVHVASAEKSLGREPPSYVSVWFLDFLGHLQSPCIIVQHIYTYLSLGLLRSIYCPRIETRTS